jgi:adenosine kinase
MAESAYSILFVGNPLLDMQVSNGEKLLEKYDLKADNAILAEEKHIGMYALAHCFSSF